MSEHDGFSDKMIDFVKKQHFSQRAKMEFCQIEKLPIHLRDNLYEIDFSFRPSIKSIVVF